MITVNKTGYTTIAYFVGVIYFMFLSYIAIMVSNLTTNDIFVPMLIIMYILGTKLSDILISTPCAKILLWLDRKSVISLEKVQ